MVSADPTADGTDAIGAPALDPDSVEWLRLLNGTGAEKEAGLDRLHELLLRIARSEVRRGSGHLQIAGPELDDVAHQAAADATLAVTAKVGQFRGDSRFTAHLRACGPCSDDFEGLLAAVTGTES